MGGGQAPAAYDFVWTGTPVDGHFVTANVTKRLPAATTNGFPAFPPDVEEETLPHFVVLWNDPEGNSGQAVLREELQVRPNMYLGFLPWSTAEYLVFWGYGDDGGWWETNNGIGIIMMTSAVGGE